MRILESIAWRFGVVSLVMQSLLWACEGDGPLWSRRWPPPTYEATPARVHDPMERYPRDQIERELWALHAAMIELGAWPPVAWQVLDVDLYVRDDIGTFVGPDGGTWTTEGTASATAVEVLAGLSEQRLREVLAAEFIDHRMPLVCVGDVNLGHASWWSGKTAEAYMRAGQIVAREMGEP